MYESPGCEAETMKITTSYVIHAEQSPILLSKEKQVSLAMPDKRERLINIPHHPRP
jgi:hypothetical protein